MIVPKCLALCGLLVAGGAAAAAPPAAMAPLADYLMPRDAEIALARSAAPASISAAATVMILGRHGYETVATGTNGYVCLVERAWESGYDDAEFWNPRGRAPICFNPPAVKTVVPAHLERTDWALAGLSPAQMRERARGSALANTKPAPGAMCFMMSRDAHLSDRDGHWHPHLMFYLSPADAPSWGANLDGSPVLGGPGNPEPVITYLIPVRRWSDGELAMEGH
ncbi:MAG: hypothetical protein WDN08_01090 [Rhizomicrobium sp.]